MLPEYIFFTGVPGSGWSGVAQELKREHGYNITDRNEKRVYRHGSFNGHCDSYFGTGMEFPSDPADGGLDKQNLDAPFTDKSGTKLVMSHEWPYYFNEIQASYPNAWIQLVYRPNWESFLWWKQAGGWDIHYPNYDWYENDVLMREKIAEQNNLILDFGRTHKLQWIQLSWEDIPDVNNIFIATYKPNES